MKKSLYLLFAFILFLAGCTGGSSGSSTNSSNSPNTNPIQLGSLPNGSEVYLSNNDLPITAGSSQKTTISLVGGAANESFSVYFNVSQLQSLAALHKAVKNSLTVNDTTGITVSPNPCIIGTSGSGSSSSCEVDISTTSGISAGTYSIVPTAVSANGSTIILSPITIEASAPAASNSKNILDFSLNGIAGTIIESNIFVTMPYGTNINSLVANYVINGQSVAINGVPQVPDTTANNFSNPVVYTVTAEDGSTQNYTVTVTVAPNTAKAISAFSLDGINGVIDGNNISVTMPYGTSLTNLVANFTTDGETVTIGNTTQVNGVTQNNFETPVTYTVYAADGSIQNYTVSVTIAPNTAKAITAFSLNGISGTIDGYNISVTLPYSTNLTDLIADFTTTGSSVTIGNTLQVDGVTPNNFESPVTYTVHAADGSTQNYVISVSPLIHLMTAGVGASIIGFESNNYSILNKPGLYFNGVAQSPNGSYVAVGNFGSMLFSSDGINWQPENPGSLAALLSVTVNQNGDFVATGNNGTILYSTDGKTWSSESSGVSAPLTNIAVDESGNFVAVGLRGTIVTSSNGIDWKVESSGTTNNLNGVTSYYGRFYVVGDKGTLLSSDSPGFNWNVLPTNISTNLNLRRIAITPNSIVIISTQGTILYSLNNGDSWETASGTNSNSLKGLTANSYGQFYAVGLNGTILTSSNNGVSWSPAVLAPSLTSTTFSNVIINNNNQAIVIGQSTTILSNNSGDLNWTIVNPPAITGTEIKSIARLSNNGEFIAVGIAGLIMNSSDNGLNWSIESSSSNFTNTLNSVATNSGGVAVAVGNSGRIMRSVNNGITWSQVSSGVSNNLYAITTNSTGEFFAVGSNSSSAVLLTSTDNGITWNKQSITRSNTESLYSIAITATGNIVVVGSQGGIYLSTDNGSTWINKSSINTELKSVAANPLGNVVTVGINGIIMSSSDNGETWTQQTSSVATNNKLYSVTTYGNTFAAVGLGYILIQNPDGSWTNITDPYYNLPQNCIIAY